MIPRDFLNQSVKAVEAQFTDAIFPVKKPSTGVLIPHFSDKLVGVHPQIWWSITISHIEDCYFELFCEYCIYIYTYIPYLAKALQSHNQQYIIYPHCIPIISDYNNNISIHIYPMMWKWYPHHGCVWHTEACHRKQWILRWTWEPGWLASGCWPLYSCCKAWWRDVDMGMGISCGTWLANAHLNEPLKGKIWENHRTKWRTEPSIAMFAGGLVMGVHQWELMEVRPWINEHAGMTGQEDEVASFEQRGISHDRT